MNILFIGPFLQKDGWGIAAKRYLKALQKTSYNVAAKPIYMSGNIDTNSEPFRGLIKKKLDKIDVVIQNVLPNILDYQPNCYNIGLCYFESRNLKHTGWIRRLNLMDEIWVPTTIESVNLMNDGVTIPINVVPIPFIHSNIEVTKTVDLSHSVDKYKFLFVGEYIQRKNINILVSAFNREFHYTEPVSLIIKTNKTGVHPLQLSKQVQNDILSAKKTFSLYEKEELYHREFLIVDYISDEELESLYMQSDCFVMPSSGESPCLPLMDAMHHGLTTIATNHTGMIDLSPDFIVDSIEVPCFVTDKPIKSLYTLNETWRCPNILSLQKCMRKAFRLSKEKRGKLDLHKSKVLNKLRPQKVAEVIEDILSEI